MEGVEGILLVRVQEGAEPVEAHLEAHRTFGESGLPLNLECRRMMRKVVVDRVEAQLFNMSMPREGSG